MRRVPTPCLPCASVVLRRFLHSFGLCRHVNDFVKMEIVMTICVESLVHLNEAHFTVPNLCTKRRVTVINLSFLQTTLHYVRVSLGLAL